MVEWSWTTPNTTVTPIKQRYFIVVDNPIKGTVLPCRVTVIPVGGNCEITQINFDTQFIQGETHLTKFIPGVPLSQTKVNLCGNPISFEGVS